MIFSLWGEMKVQAQPLPPGPLSSVQWKELGVIPVVAFTKNVCTCLDLVHLALPVLSR